MNLSQLVLSGSVDIDEIAEVLDAASPSERLEASRSLDRSAQRVLYEKACSAPPLTLAHFVPEDRGAKVQVRHYGRNTLPLPGGLRNFEKRFCRPDGDDGRLFGYNEGATRPAIGPGYFVVVETAKRADWRGRGSVVVDYFEVPDGDVAPGWPRVVPNHHGLQRMVFYQTRDFMRRVSSHVSIGAAYKRDKPLDHYFTLCREP